MDLWQLKVFANIVEWGSFSEAAVHLDRSQAALSRAIASLEDELGISLLDRGRFGARLTPVGERVLSHVRKVLQLRQSMEHEVNLHKGLQVGSVRIAAFRSAATHILPPVMARFRQQFPTIGITITEEDPSGVEASLHLRHADIGLIPLPRATDDLETWAIAQDEYIVLLPQSVGRVPQSLTWQDLSAYAYILFNYAECTTAVRNHWSEAQQTLRVAYEVKEDSTIVNMVAQGLGAAILPRLAAIPIPEGIVVRQLPVPLVRVIGAGILTQAMHSPAVFAFLDALRGTGIFRPE